MGQTIGGLKMVVRFEVDACVAAPQNGGEGEKGEFESEPSLRAGASTSAAEIETAISVPARQSFTDEEEAALWGIGSTAEDWGVEEQAPKPQTPLCDSVKMKAEQEKLHLESK